MTSEQMVQQMFEASYTGSEVFFLLTSITISISSLAIQLVFVYAGYRLIKQFFDKRKILREGGKDARED